jgi:protein-tyrosine phosphatase
MLDLHCHLLPGVDDGAADLGVALEMAQVLVEAGFVAVAPSPHMGAGPGGDVSPQLATERLGELRRELHAAAIDLELLANGEHYVSVELFERIAAGEVVTVGGQSRWLMVELPWGGLADVEGVLFRLQTRGYRLLLAHPERAAFVDLDTLARLVDRGVRIQVEIGSFVGGYGVVEEERAWTLLERRLVHVLATDLHGPEGASEWLPAALAEVARHSAEALQRATLDNPRRIVADAPANAIEPA